jgi:hypothetical protein
VVNIAVIPYTLNDNKFAMIIILAATLGILASALILIPVQDAAALIAREASGLHIRAGRVAVDAGTSGLSIIIGGSARSESTASTR